MKGNRKNYGKGDDGLRVTVRLYGPLRQHLEDRAKRNGASVADNILWYLEMAADWEEKKLTRSA